MVTSTTAATSGATLHTTNSGAVIRRTLRLLPGHIREGRERAAEIAEKISADLPDRATVRAYHEFAGGRDHVHYLLNLKTLGEYDEVSARLDEVDDHPGVVPGSQSEVLLIPQHWGMYGTSDALPPGARIDPAAANLLVPPAQLQTMADPAETLSSDRAGVLLHRYAQPKYAFRGEARAFARRITESINTRMQGIASSFVFEEAFGVADRVHWLIHLRDVSAYYDLIDMHMRMEPEVMSIYTDQAIPEEKGGGTWARIFVEDSMFDVAMAPARAGQ